MAWDQREVELQRHLDQYDHQQTEILSTALKVRALKVDTLACFSELSDYMNMNLSVQFEEATGSVPDPSLPIPQQLELALRKIQEQIQTILETRATCRSLEEVI